MRDYARVLTLFWSQGSGKALVSWCGNRVRSGESRPRVGKAAASRSPLEFRDALLGIARSARVQDISPTETAATGEQAARIQVNSGSVSSSQPPKT
jgi:hypothetical protein